MGVELRIFYAVLAILLTVAVCIIAYTGIHNLLIASPSKNAVAVDFNAILTVLLTTVTVIFTVCAILLTTLGIIGFRNLKRDAGRYAENQAMAEIARAFDRNGRAIKWIEQEMLNEDGHHRKFIQKHIRFEVIQLMPLITARHSRDDLGMAGDEPTDEGDID